MTFHALSKKRFKLQHKAKRNLKSDPSYHLLKKALIACEKVPMIAWETSLFNGCTYKHSSYTHREICNYVLEGKNSSKGLNFNKKWRKTTNGTHRSIFWRRRWKSTVRQFQTHLHLIIIIIIILIVTSSWGFSGTIYKLFQFIKAKMTIKTRNHNLWRYSIKI